MRDLVHWFRKPARQPWPDRCERVQFGCRQRPLQPAHRFAGLCRPKPCQFANSLAGGSAGQDKLPLRRVLQLDGLPPELQRAAGPGGQINPSNRNLGRKAQCVGRRGAARDNCFAPLGRHGFDDLLDRGRAHAEPAFNRSDVNASAGT